MDISVKSLSQCLLQLHCKQSPACTNVRLLLSQNLEERWYSNYSKREMYSWWVSSLQIKVYESLCDEIYTLWGLFSIRLLKMKWYGKMSVCSDLRPEPLWPNTVLNKVAKIFLSLYTWFYLKYPAPLCYQKSCFLGTRSKMQ